MPFSCYCNNGKFRSTVNTTLTVVTVAGERPSVLLVLCPSCWVCAQPSLLSVYQGNWFDCGEGGTDSPIPQAFPSTPDLAWGFGTRKTTHPSYYNNIPFGLVEETTAANIYFRGLAFGNYFQFWVLEAKIDWVRIKTSSLEFFVLINAQLSILYTLRRKRVLLGNNSYNLCNKSNPKYNKIYGREIKQKLFGPTPFLKLNLDFLRTKGPVSNTILIPWMMLYLCVMFLLCSCALTTL